MGRIRFFGGLGAAAVRLGNNAGLLDAERIDIGDQTPGGGGKSYEWDNNAAVGVGKVLVTIGASAALSAIELRDKINANKPTPPCTAFIDPLDTSVVRIEADARGTRGNMPLVETMADPLNVISGPAFVGGEDALNQVVGRSDYVVTPIDVAAGSVVISTGLPTTIRFPQIECRTATGVRKILTSLVSSSGSRIQIDFDGATNPVAGDKISWMVWE